MPCNKQYLLIVVILSLIFGQLSARTVTFPFPPHLPSAPADTIKLPDSLYTYFWRTNIGYWVNEDLDLFYYDHNTDLTKWNRKHWDESYGYFWYDDYRILYTRKERLPVEETKQVYDLQMSEWINYTLFTYAYDGHGNRTEWKWQKWDSELPGWTNFRLNQYFYDDSDQQVLTVSRIWDNNSPDWILSQQIETFYDNSGSDTLIHTSYWSSSDSAWINLSLKTSWYDLNGNKVREQMQFWDTESAEWINSSNGLSSYDDQNHLLQTVYQHWDAGLNAWVDKTVTGYLYNELGLISHYITTLWDPADSVWMKTSRGIYEYDTEGDEVDFILQDWNQQEEWENRSRMHYVYKKVLSLEDMNPPGGISCRWTCFSPENKCLNCEGLKENASYIFTLYSMQGGRILTQVFKGDQPIFLRDRFPSGAYILTITGKDLPLYSEKIFIP